MFHLCAAFSVLSTADFYGPIAPIPSANASLERGTNELPFPYLSPGGLPGVASATQTLQVATFDGVSQSIDLSASSLSGYTFSRATAPNLYATGMWSIAFWLRLDQQMIDGAGSPSSFNLLQCSSAINNFGALAIFFNRGTLSLSIFSVGIVPFLMNSNQQPQIGEWMHIAFVFGTSNLITGYSNGQLIGTMPAPTMPSMQQPTCYLSGRTLAPNRGKSTEFLAGAMYGFGIWTRTLSLRELQALVGPSTVEQLLHVTPFVYRIADTTQPGVLLASIPMTTLMPYAQFPSFTFDGTSSYDLNATSAVSGAPPSLSQVGSWGASGLTISMWFLATASVDGSSELLILGGGASTQTLVIVLRYSVHTGNMLVKAEEKEARRAKNTIVLYLAHETLLFVYVLQANFNTISATIFTCTRAEPTLSVCGHTSSSRWIILS